MEVLIFEGPAGAGKTTAIERLVRSNPNVYQYDREGKIDRPRSYAGVEHLALVKDMAQIAFLLTTEQDYVVLDRFWISSLIYDKLRRDQTLTVKETSKEMEKLFFLMGWTINHFRERNYPNVNTKFQLQWHFIIPPMDVLVKQRKESGKEYPYNTAREYWMYNTFRSHLQELGMLAPDENPKIT